MTSSFSGTIKTEAADELDDHIENGGVNFEEADADEPEIIYVYADIRSSIETLKVLLQEKTKKNLSYYEIWLQNAQMLEPFKMLCDQCVNGEGLVQVNTQILDGHKRINITDVVKPTENVDIAAKSYPVAVDTDIVMNKNDEGNNHDSLECEYLL